MTGKAIPLRAAVRACDSLADFQKLITCRGQRHLQHPPEADLTVMIPSPSLNRLVFGESQNKRIQYSTNVSEESSRWEGVVDVV